MILLADDNAVDRRILKRFVVGEGFEVVEADDGVEALEAYRAHRPEVVLLDALMPRLDGFEVAKVIKEEAGDDFVPIVFLTSLTEAEDLARCLSAGGDDFLSKPYNRIILKAKLEAIHRQRALHLALRQHRDEIDHHRRQLVRDQEAAKQTFDRIAHREYLDLPCLNYVSSPLALFNGDVVLAAPTPRGSLNLLVGDFTGHGLTASVGALPLAESFYSLSARGFSLKAITRECNRRLADILSPGTFCCASFAEVNLQRGQVELWLGGLPPALRLSAPGARGRETVELVSGPHLPLGILPDEAFDASTDMLKLDAGERLLFFSDGLIETTNIAGEEFGLDRLQAALAVGIGERSAVDAALAAVQAYSGASQQADDLTLLEVVMDPSLLLSGATVVNREPVLLPPAWALTFSVEDQALASFDPMSVFGPLLQSVPAVRPIAGAIGLVLTELFANALDHGILALDSAIKGSAEGFADYFAERQRRLERVSGRIELQLHYEEDAERGRLKLSMSDSGAGFSPEAFNNGSKDEQLHGRGLNLIGELCDSVSHADGGRTTQVVMSVAKATG